MNILKLKLKVYATKKRSDWRKDDCTKNLKSVCTTAHVCKKCLSLQKCYIFSGSVFMVGGQKQQKIDK